MIRIAVCDDEGYMRQAISDMSAEYFKGRTEEMHISVFKDGRSLLDSGGVFDLAFLDIQMEGLSGMETARILRAREFKGLLIFITVLKECVFESFEVEPFDYLVKPLDAGRFFGTMDRAMRHILQEGKMELVVRRSGGYSVVPYEDIIYLESINRKVYVHMKEKKVIDYYCKMEDLEKELGGGFFRCHRSYMINLYHIRGYESGSACMDTGEKVPVSRLRGQEFSQAVLKYLAEKKHS